MRSQPRRLTLALLVALMTSPCLSQPSITSQLTVPTLGNPTTAISTEDGRYLFVSVTNVGQPNFTGSDRAAGARKDAVSGIQVFRCDHAHEASSMLHSIAFVRTGSTGANGLVLLRGERTLAVGVGDEGVAFLDVRALIRGKAHPLLAHQTEAAGTFDVVASPDGPYVFSSNEYGVVNDQRGSVGIIRTHIDRHGRVMAPETIDQIPAGDVVPSLSISKDGSRLYIASELGREHDPMRIAGRDIPELTKSDCLQRKGSAPKLNGYITVVDAARAESHAADAVLSRVASGCSPVRIIESEDSSALFVSARGDDKILVFHPVRLEHDPEHALIRTLRSGGPAPVGIALLNRDKYLAVANSNRFAESDGNLAILTPFETNSNRSLVTLPASRFPRNIRTDSDHLTLYLTNFSSRTLMRITIARN